MIKLLYFATWVMNICFWISSIPQVFLNWKLKSARGVSDLMLLGYFNGFIAFNYFVFCLDLPLSFKVFVPISFATTLIMIGQRFFYDRGGRKDKHLLRFYAVNGLFACMLLPYAMNHVSLVGNIAGWLSAAIWGIYQIPQIVKNHVDKSVIGFSFALVLLIGFGDILGLVTAIGLKMPIQTVCNGFRGVFTFLVLCGQFFIYRRGSQECLTEKN